MHLTKRSFCPFYLYLKEILGFSPASHPLVMNSQWKYSDQHFCNILDKDWKLGWMRRGNKYKHTCIFPKYLSEKI
jgi:hypothetical protein